MAGTAEGDAARMIGAHIEGTGERAGVLARQLQLAPVVVGREAGDAPLGRAQAVAHTVGPVAILATHGFPPWECGGLRPLWVLGNDMPIKNIIT